MKFSISEHRIWSIFKEESWKDVETISKVRFAFFNSE